MSTVDTTRIVKLSFVYHEFGAWYCDTVLDSSAALAVGSRVTLTIGDLPLIGYVKSSDADDPGQARAVIVGTPGWDRQLTAPLSYESVGSVLLSTVLQDLSTLAGEPIEQPADRSIGNAFAVAAQRPGEPLLLRDVLAAMVRAGFVSPWRADPDGVTRFGARSGVPVTARATRLGGETPLGMTRLAIDSPAAFLPGALYQGLPITRLDIYERSSKLEAHVYTSLNSLATMVLRKVAEWFPQLFYGYPRTYIVATVRDDQRLDLVPPPDAPHLAELLNVEQWNLGGSLTLPAVGASVTVSFRDALPTRPIILGFAPALPAEITLDASDRIRVGDSADEVEIAGGGRELAAPGTEIGQAIAYGDTVQMFIGLAQLPTPVKLMRAGTLIDLAGSPVAPISKVTL